MNEEYLTSNSDEQRYNIKCQLAYRRLMESYPPEEIIRAMLEAFGLREVSLALSTRIYIRAAQLREPYPGTASKLIDWADRYRVIADEMKKFRI